MAKIKEITSYFPLGKITNKDLSKRFDKWTEEKIFEKTGIKLRNKADEDETAADLAVGAAKKLIKNYKINIKEIDMLLFVTQTPNQCLPTSACEIHRELNLRKECGAFDINQGCTGYIYGLFLANSIIESGNGKNVLLLTGDTYSKIIDENDASVATLFGDGASATLVSEEINKVKSIGRFEFGTDGSKSKLLNCDFGGFRKAKEEWKKLTMDGANILIFTLNEIPKAIKKYLINSEKDLQKYDFIVFHQANKFILERLYKKLEIEDKGVISIDKCGNTVSSSIPIALEKIINEQKRKELNILLVGFGVGLSWGITSIKI